MYILAETPSYTGVRVCVCVFAYTHTLCFVATYNNHFPTKFWPLLAIHVHLQKKTNGSSRARTREVVLLIKGVFLPSKFLLDSPFLEPILRTLL